MKQILKAALIINCSLLIINYANAQPLHKQAAFTHADTLRGSNGPGRDWWDVLRYDISLTPDIKNQTITGETSIAFKVLNKGNLMQIDLQDPLVIDSIELTNSSAVAENNVKPITKARVSIVSTEKIESFAKDGNAYFINMPELKVYNELKIYYHGKPVIAKLPPWDGGMVWAKDKSKNPWVSIACQGLGASVWYPCKDIQSDEPDNGASLTVTIPDTLVCVANGRLVYNTKNDDKTVTYKWEVESPINNYTIIPYIGKYAHFEEDYNGEKGKLNMDYWVLEENLAKARTHFSDATRTMKALEYWFGPYPFYEDGYKLADAPYLGMEHQSDVAYGNEYKMGYLGKDRSGTGWGLKWDYIIVHESGHEWFGNNITTKDIADMWVHEGFTTYSETLFTEYFYGKKAGSEYCIGLRRNIENDMPIIGTYGVNKEGSTDMYDKGANMIHTIRQVIDNDSLFRQILRGLNSTFYHQTVTSKQVEDYICKQSKTDLTKIFDQYLRTIQIPVLEYKINGAELSYRWTNCIKGFNMPLKVTIDNEQFIKPTEEWQKLKLSSEGDTKFAADPNFYINTKKVD